MWALLVAAVTLAGSASSALAQANHVYAVGGNEDGQLGIGDTWWPHPGLIRDVTAVAGGSYHSLAVKGDGTVWA
jgi:alpha-tubulin suppressor-like RCC1 family protein